MFNLNTVTWPKIEIFKIQDGGSRHLENRFSGHYSSTDCPISATFCMSKQNGMLVRAYGTKKMQIFKIQDSGQLPFWKSSNRHISVKNYPISMKFGTLQQMLNPIAVTWPKIKRFKIQDGRHLENRDITISPLNCYWILTIWCTTAYLKPNEVFKSAIAVS